MLKEEMQEMGTEIQRIIGIKSPEWYNFHKNIFLTKYTFHSFG